MGQQHGPGWGYLHHRLGQEHYLRWTLQLDLTETTHDHQGQAF